MSSGKNINSDKNFKQNWFVLRQLASREIKHGNSSKWLGQMWNILTPFVSMITMAVLFAFVFKQDIKVFMPYVFTGTIIYGFYDDAMGGAMRSLSGNKTLLIRTKIPENLYVIEKIYVALIRMSFSLVGYVIILIITQTPVGPFLALAPVGIIFAIFISMGIGKILAVINVYFADISYFYKIIMRLVFYASAIFYHLDKAAPAMRMVIGNNPVYLTIHFERACILYNHMPEPLVWIKLAIFAASLYIVGSLIFRKGSQDVVAKL